MWTTLFYAQRAIHRQDFWYPFPPPGQTSTTGGGQADASARTPASWGKLVEWVVGGEPFLLPTSNNTAAGSPDLVAPAAPPSAAGASAAENLPGKLLKQLTRRGPGQPSHKSM